MNLISKEICAQHQPYRRVEIPLIINKEVDDVKNVTVEGWLSSQNSDTFPNDVIFDTLIYKRHFECQFEAQTHLARYSATIRRASALVALRTSGNNCRQSAVERRPEI